MTMMKLTLGLLVVVVMLLPLLGCEQPPYYKAPGERVKLINNSSARARSWEEVDKFLERQTYPEGKSAEILHNRAEYYGFKTAYVIVEFEDSECISLNAFKTIDYGLVYVAYETIAHVVEGRKVVFSKSLAFDWDEYDKCMEEWITRKAQYEDNLATYKSDCKKLSLVAQQWLLKEEEKKLPDKPFWWGEYQRRREEFWGEQIHKVEEKTTEDAEFIKIPSDEREQVLKLFEEIKRLNQEESMVRNNPCSVEETESIAKRVKIYW